MNTNGYQECVYSIEAIKDPRPHWSTQSAYNQTIVVVNLSWSRRVLDHWSLLFRYNEMGDLFKLCLTKEMGRFNFNQSQATRYIIKEMGLSDYIEIK
jgi:hypothetical protein